ncbi:MAG: phage tail protein [Marinisporobacter sp.]|jgi:phage tail-like protein|nr:phage tail protein [Marinisporobacter sp.]
MADRKDPIRNFRYKVSVGGAEAGFSEVTGFDISIDTIEYREGDDPTTPYKLPGLTKYSNLTLKHGVTDDMELYNWIKDCVEGRIERKVVTIIALGEDGSPLATWEVVEAWPVKYNAPDFNATGAEVAIESMELAHEGLKRTA